MWPFLGQNLCPRCDDFFLLRASSKAEFLIVQPLNHLGCLLKMQISGPHPWLTESESPGAKPKNLHPNKLQDPFLKNTQVCSYHCSKVCPLPMYGSCLLALHAQWHCRCERVVSLRMPAALALTTDYCCQLLRGKSKWKRHAPKNHSLTLRGATSPPPASRWAWQRVHFAHFTSEGEWLSQWILSLLSGPTILKMSNFPIRTFCFSLLGSYPPIKFHWFLLQARSSLSRCPVMELERVKFLLSLYCYLTVSFWTHDRISL